MELLPDSPPKLERQRAMAKDVENEIKDLGMINGIDQWEIFQKLPLSDEQRERILIQLKAEAQKPKDESTKVAENPEKAKEDTPISPRSDLVGSPP